MNIKALMGAEKEMDVHNNAAGITYYNTIARRVKVMANALKFQ
jgi:hypothetical protein